VTVYLHIGAGKVGSTSIQGAAFAHRTTLASAGVLYPVDALWRRNHAALARELRGRRDTGSLALLGELLARRDATCCCPASSSTPSPRRACTRCGARSVSGR
jgi:hypothetical protein